MLGACVPSSTHLYERNAESIAFASFDILALLRLLVSVDSRNSVIQRFVAAISVKALARSENLRKSGLNESEAAVLSHLDNVSILRDKWGRDD